MSRDSRGTVKSRPTHVVRKTKQPLTNQFDLRSRTGVSPQRFLLKYTCFSGCARLKPTALSESHGSIRRGPTLERGRSTSSTTVTTPHPTTIAALTKSRISANPQRIFFSLNGGVSLQVGGAEAPPNSGREGRYRADREALSKQCSGVGARTPTPASHHVGVSGGVLNHHVTPTRCEAARGVVSDV